MTVYVKCWQTRESVSTEGRTVEWAIRLILDSHKTIVAPKKPTDLLPSGMWLLDHSKNLTASDHYIVEWKGMHFRYLRISG